MPPMEIVRQSGEPQTNGDIESEVKSPEESPQHVNSDSNALLDLLVDFGGTTTTPQPVSTTTTTSNKVDLLDLFNEMDNIDTPALQSLPVTDSTNLGLIVENNNGSLPLVINQNSNFIGGDLLSNTKAVNEKDVPIITAYDKDGLNMCFSLDKVPDSNTLTINAVATNQTLSTMTDFLFQAAVPKTFQLQMMSPSGTIMGPNGQITQVLRVTNPNKSTLKMRIRLSYTIDGNPVQVQTEVNNFPTEIWD
jgi:AP-1 complex subunit gamma-1